MLFSGCITRRVELYLRRRRRDSLPIGKPIEVGVFCDLRRISPIGVHDKEVNCGLITDTSGGEHDVRAVKRPRRETVRHRIIRQLYSIAAVRVHYVNFDSVGTHRVSTAKNNLRPIGRIRWLAVNDSVIRKTRAVIAVGVDSVNLESIRIKHTAAAAHENDLRSVRRP